jgi:hypothetical protein
VAHCVFASRHRGRPLNSVVRRHLGDLVNLEQQLAALSSLGLPLADGVTVDDLLHSFDRREFEEKPYDLVLFALGSEVERQPWGRYVCPRAWNFDTECINEQGDYTGIVSRLSEMTGDPGYLSEVGDTLDLDRGTGTLLYKVNGEQRRWNLEVNDDWADTRALSHVMADLERDGSRFYAKDNGQAMIIFYLNSSAADRLNKLSGDALKPLTGG